MATLKESSSDKNIETSKQVYAGISRNDVDLVLSLFDADVHRVEFEGLPNSRRYQGHIDLRQHITDGRSTWAEGTCEPIKFISNKNKMVVKVHVKVRLKNETKWIDAYVADGFSFKDGLVSEFHSFTNEQKAFEWADMPAKAEAF